MNDKLKFKMQNMPKKPGCYLWKDINDQVIYVGKAKNLFNRTHHYFDRPNDLKTSKLVNEIYDVEFFVVSNENEALLLENNLIKKYRPKFNVLLKDSSGYPYIVVTDEKNPRIIYTRNNHDFKGKYYGPFATNDSNKYEIYNLLKQIFPLRKCNTLKKTKCLYYDIGQCLAPCENNVDIETYNKIKNDIDDFFNNKGSKILENLKLLELKSSENLEFEKAQKFKILIDSIKNLITTQNVQFASKQDIDFIGFFIKDDFISISIFSYQDGKLLAKIQEIFELYNDPTDVIVDFISQYYLDNFNKPKTIYVSLDEENIKQLSQLLDIKFIKKPSKGKKLDILNNVISNASTFLETNYLLYKAKVSNRSIANEELKKILNIKKLDNIIAFDISNLFNQDKVAAVISLKDGIFDRYNYRKFIIKNKKATSDYECMKEAVERYILQTKSYPDLIIMDGGKIQVNAALEVLQLYNLQEKILVMGLAKNDAHKTNYMVYENKEMPLIAKTKLYNFLLSIQEEVHNYAISFFRKKNVRSLFKSALDNIDDLGEKRKKILMEKYENISNLKKASVEELAQLIPMNVAIALKQKLENE